MNNTSANKFKIVIGVVVGGAALITKVAEIYKKHRPEIDAIIKPFIENCKLLVQKQNTKIAAIQ